MNRFTPVALSLLSGILLGMSWPNLGNLTPLVFLGFVPLFHLADQLQGGHRSNLKYFLLTYLGLLTWNFIDTYWLFYVQGSFGTRFMSAFMPSFLNAMLMALPFVLFFIAKKRLSRNLAYVAFASFWISYELLHLNWDLSWPWLVLGNVFSGNVNWVQWYEFTGALGGSLWIIMANVLFYETIRHFGTNQNWKRFGLPVLFVVLPIALSYSILALYEIRGTSSEVVIDQPNLDAYGEKFTVRYDIQLAKSLKACEDKSTPKTEMILFPETALQEGVSVNQDASGQLVLSGLWENDLRQAHSIQLLQQYFDSRPKLTLLTGIPTDILYPSGPEAPTLTARILGGTDRYYDTYNTALWFTHKQMELYHKSKLVPGAEILPFAFIMKPLLGDAILEFGGSSSSMATQKDRTVFSRRDMPIKAAPVICYESIYGSYVGDYVKNGANLICIMTNDGWWDVTAGHKHHLAYSKLRAIEHRRDVVRSANTGISAHINQKGEITQSLDYNTEGVIRTEVRLNEEETFYTQFGDYIGWGSVVIAAYSLVMMVVRRFRRG